MNTIKIKTENFEGPLDLLIHLIEKKKMDINAINISQIIDDYLNYIHSQKELNLKIKVEFLIMATDLIEIKAYSVLNRDKKIEKIENLEKKIIEYRLFKEISELFSKYENPYNISYTRTGTKSIENEIEYDISSLTLDNLFKSLKNLINSNKKNKPEEQMLLNLEKDTYSTEDAYKEISEIITANNEIEFNRLLKNKFSKAPFGWNDKDIEWIVAKAFKDGEIELKKNGNNLTLLSESSQEIIDNITKKDNSERLYLEIKEKIDERSIKVMYDVANTLFDKNLDISDTDKMIQEFRRLSNDKITEIENSTVIYSVGEEVKIIQEKIYWKMGKNFLERCLD